MSRKIVKKQIVYDMINFYFKLSGTFPIVQNDCLQHYVNISIKIAFFTVFFVFLIFDNDSKL